MNFDDMTAAVNDARQKASMTEPHPLPVRYHRWRFMGFRGIGVDYLHRAMGELGEGIPRHRREWTPGPLIVKRSIMGGRYKRGDLCPASWRAGTDRKHRRQASGFIPETTRKGFLSRLVELIVGREQAQRLVRNAPKVYPHSATRQRTRAARAWGRSQLFFTNNVGALI